MVIKGYARLVAGAVITGCWVTTQAAPVAPAPAKPATTASEPIDLAPVAVRARASEAEIVSPLVLPDLVDTAQVMDNVPGGAALDNGGLAGQVQFRGLTGYRNQVTIDGMGIASGGPNWMDPPLHYAPAALVDNVSVTRGIPSVTDSVDAIGTTVNATTRRSEYALDSDYAVHGWAQPRIESVNNGYGLAGQASVANENNRLGVTAATDQASNLRTPYGVLNATSYDRKQYGIDAGHRGRFGETSAFVRAQRTGDSGNADLPLDTDFFHTWMGQIEHEIEIADWHLSAELSGNHVEHRMANSLLRPAPDFSPLNGARPDPRFIRARSQQYATRLRAAHGLAGGRATLGFDGQFAQHDAFVGNPNNAAFRVDNFDDIRRNTYSGFAQWAGALDHLTGNSLSDAWRGELGLRYTHIDMSAGPGGVTPGLPAPAQRLAAGFAATDRDQGDDNIDIVGKLSRAFGERWQASLGLARKTRSPYYIERYAFIPLEASAGAADGNNVIGDTSLDPEVAYMADLGLSFTGTRLSVSPQVYYHRINDYIDAVAFDDTPGVVDSDVERVSRVNGDATPLQYSNVEAEIYGADIAASYALGRHWQLDGGAGYTRGKRVDVNDNLYRIAPGHVRAQLTWANADWQLRLAERYVFAQNDTADYRTDPSVADPATGGYALTDIAARYQASEAVWVEVGVDNLLNRGYRDFLAGFNRAGNSAVPVGARLPGAGRNAYATLNWSF